MHSQQDGARFRAAASREEREDERDDVTVVAIDGVEEIIATTHFNPFLFKYRLITSLLFIQFM